MAAVGAFRQRGRESDDADGMGAMNRALTVEREPSRRVGYPAYLTRAALAALAVLVGLVHAGHIDARLQARRPSWPDVVIDVALILAPLLSVALSVILIRTRWRIPLLWIAGLVLLVACLAAVFLI